MMTDLNRRCSCGVCTSRRREETSRLLGQPASNPAEIYLLAVAILVPVLALIGILAAWLVGR